MRKKLMIGKRALVWSTLVSALLIAAFIVFGVAFIILVVKWGGPFWDYIKDLFRFKM